MNPTVTVCPQDSSSTKSRRCRPMRGDQPGQNVANRFVTRDRGSRITARVRICSEGAMLRILLPISPMLAVSSMLVACTPSPQKAAMPSSTPVSTTIRPDSGKTAAKTQDSIAPGSVSRGTAYPEQAARASVSAPISVAGDLAPRRHADLPEAALGRRIVSTAFVRVGPDGHLTVELHDGRVLVLRDVVMRPSDYCGVQVSDDAARGRYCGGYAEVAAARPGGAPALGQPNLAVSEPVKPVRDR